MLAPIFIFFLIYVPLSNPHQCLATRYYSVTCLRNLSFFFQSYPTDTKKNILFPKPAMTPLDVLLYMITTFSLFVLSWLLHVCVCVCERESQENKNKEKVMIIYSKTPRGVMADFGKRIFFLSIVTNFTLCNVNERKLNGQLLCHYKLIITL